MHHNIPDSAGLICSQQAIQSVLARTAGCFKINSWTAFTLTPKAPGELRIVHGRVWLTFANAADDASVRAGDHFLQAGDLLRLLPGQQLVMEVYDKDVAQNAYQSAYFSWEPDTGTSPVALHRRALHAHAEVRQPLRDLGAALQA